MEEQNSNTNTAGPEEEAVKPRREAMKKIGKYAAYTAPAMAAMLSSKKAAAGIISMPV